MGSRSAHSIQAAALGLPCAHSCHPRPPDGISLHRQANAADARHRILRLCHRQGIVPKLASANGLGGGGAADAGRLGHPHFAALCSGDPGLPLPCAGAGLHWPSAAAVRVAPAAMAAAGRPAHPAAARCAAKDPAARCDADHFNAHCAGSPDAAAPIGRNQISPAVRAAFRGAGGDCSRSAPPLPFLYAQHQPAVFLRAVDRRRSHHPLHALHAGLPGGAEPVRLGPAADGRPDGLLLRAAFPDLAHGLAACRLRLHRLGAGLLHLRCPGLPQPLPEHGRPAADSLRRLAVRHRLGRQVPGPGLHTLAAGMGLPLFKELASSVAVHGRCGGGGPALVRLQRHPHGQSHFALCRGGFRLLALAG